MKKKSKKEYECLRINMLLIYSLNLDAQREATGSLLGLTENLPGSPSQLETIPLLLPPKQPI